MRRIRALTLPPVICGGVTCLAGLQDSLTLSCLWMPMPALFRLCLSLSVVLACANRGTLVGPCSTAPWWSLACVFLPRSGQSIHRPSLGLLMVGRLAALIMSLCHAPGAVAPGSVRSCHIVAPREARDVADTCSVHVVDSAGGWEDHFLVASRAPLVIRWAPRGAQWKVEGVDRAALKYPVCCSKFKCALGAIKSPPWSMSVDEHGRFAAGAVRKAAKVAFGAPVKRPRREHIDCAAWALICDRRIVKTWCRERRVSAAARGIVPGRTPDPLWVCMWASSRGGSAPLARHVFSELAAQVAPLVEGAGPWGGLWEFLRVFLRHSGGVLKGYLKAACVAFLGSTACELDAAQADRAHDLAWRELRSLTCRGGAT